MNKWTSTFLAWQPVRLAWRDRGQALNVVMAILALLVFGATFRVGIERGMDQMVGVQAYGRVISAIAAVMTKQQFGQGGYAISNCIFSELERRGFTADPEIAKKVGVTVPENLRSALFLDKVLDDMRRDLPKLPDHCGYAIRGFGADDIGYIDFAELAFFLFGPQIRALYYLFFSIYGLALLCALLERHKDRMGQIVLLGAAGLIYVSCYDSNFLQPEPPGSGNMLNPRFIAVLAVIPGVHLLLMLVDKAVTNWWRIAIVVFQSGVIFFAIHIRATAAWWVLALFLAALTLFLVSLKGDGAGREGWRSLICRSLAAQWPAWVALLVIFTGIKCVAWSLHPIYRAEGWLQQHALWHSIYYSLMSHPKYAEKYSAYHDHKQGDEMPVMAAHAYLKAHPEEDTPDIYFPDSKSLKYADMERLIRLALFDFVRRDPWFVFETFVIVKGRATWWIVIGAIRTEWSNAGWKARFLLILVITLISTMAARHAAGWRRLSRLTVIMTIGAIASLSIPILTVTSYELNTEMIMAVQVAIALLLSLAFAHLVRATARYRFSKSRGAFGDQMLERPAANTVRSEI